jgi:hypothetical protein
MWRYKMTENTEKIQALVDEYNKNDKAVKELQEKNTAIHDKVTFGLHGVKPGVVVEELSSWGGEPKPTGKFYIVTGILHNVSYSDKITDIPNVMAKALKKDGKVASRPATRLFDWKLAEGFMK